MPNCTAKTSNQSINLTGNNRVLKIWKNIGRQVISPLCAKKISPVNNQRKNDGTKV